ncbi:MAG: DNA polymerase domain-containing protein, partial [Chthoniobacterales bacterium]
VNPASEKVAIERLNALIVERDPDVIEGHNIFKFDIPFLTVRAKKYRLRLKWGRDGSVISARSSRLQIAEKTIQYPRCSIHGRHVVDTFILAQLYDVGTRELDGFGLKSVAAHFGLTENDRVVLDGDELQTVRLSDPARFELYALQDVRETRALSATLALSYFVQAQIFPYNFQDVITRGNATKINALFLRAYFAAGHSLPGLPDAVGFEGGYTDIFFTGVLRDVWHCDVASLYPSVILQFGLLPRGDSLGVFRSMLTDLRTYRLEAKARVRTAENETERLRFDAMQAVFKILINSFYGYLGFAQGHFADFQAAAAVTAKGREILRTMVEWLTTQGAKVIEIDTDGIYFQPPVGVGVEVLDAGMRRVLPDGIEVEFDKKFAAMFSYKAKNYALLDEDGRVTLKGAALKSRGMEPY